MDPLFYYITVQTMQPAAAKDLLQNPENKNKEFTGKLKSETSAILYDFLVWCIKLVCIVYHVQNKVRF